MIKSIVHTLRQHSSFKGRSKRSEFCYFQLFSLLVLLLDGALFSFVFKSYLLVGSTPEKIPLLIPICAIFIILNLFALFWLQLAIYVRRLHDINASGRWMGAYLGLSIVCGIYTAFEFEALRTAVAYGTANTPLLIAGSLHLLATCSALALFLICCLEPGDKGANKYGEAPRSKATLSPEQTQAEALEAEEQ